MEKPKHKYSVNHTGFSKSFFEWEEEEAEREFNFWKNYYDSSDKYVTFFKDGKPIKTVTFKVEIIEENL